MRVRAATAPGAPPPAPRRARLTPGDAREVAALAARCFPQPWNPAQWREELARETARVWGLRRADDGGLVAFVDFWEVRDEIHVLNLATDPSARRRGHARTLLDAVLRFGRVRGHRLVTLEVRRSNAAAKALYRGLDFAVAGARPGYYDDGEDALIMTRRLS